MIQLSMVQIVGAPSGYLKGRELQIKNVLLNALEIGLRCVVGMMELITQYR